MEVVGYNPDLGINISENDQHCTLDIGANIELRFPNQSCVTLDNVFAVIVKQFIL